MSDSSARVVALDPSVSPEQYLRELADREAGKLHGVMVVLLRKDEEKSTLTAWTGGLTQAERVFGVASLDHAVKREIFDPEYQNWTSR